MTSAAGSSSPETWDHVFMDMAYVVARRSKDPRTKVGAILVSPDRREIAVGYNGFPAGFPDAPEIWGNRDVNSKELNKYDVVIHGELNAILNCHVRPQGWSLYCTHMPCVRCAAAILQAGIKRVAYSQEIDTPHLCQDKAKELLCPPFVELLRLPRDPP